MALAPTTTLIPLDRFATILQIDPLHFNGVVSENRPTRNACDDLWFQHDYQWAGRVSRESLAEALYQAEQTVAGYLGFMPLPAWIAAEECRIDQPLLPESYSLLSVNLRGFKKSIRAKWGMVQSTGRRGSTLISAGAAVVYSSVDGDTYKEHAQVVVATTVTDPDEISIFYPGKSASPAWEIRPTTVVISGGNATITFRREQAAIESELEKQNDMAEGASGITINGDDDTKFLTTVDVYRIYNDPSQQATFLTEDTCGSCDGDGCAVCGLTADTGCLSIRDQRLSILAYNSAVWNAVTQTFDSAPFNAGREPDRIKIWYRAGLRDENQTLPNRQMHPMWERMICFYAVTLLDTEVSGCENTKRIFFHQREDLALSTKSGTSFSLSPANLDCPLGTSRAAIALWRAIQTSLHGRLSTAR